MLRLLWWSRYHGIAFRVYGLGVFCKGIAAICHPQALQDRCRIFVRALHTLGDLQFSLKFITRTIVILCAAAFFALLLEV